MFNHKGGVSKTTTTFNLGWMLALLNERVLLVDADPQCNLSGLVLGYKGRDEFEKFYTKEEKRNLKAGLAPAFEAQPRSMEAVQPVAVNEQKVPGLYLLPGHIRLSEYEVTLGIAQELSGSIQTLQNLPGSLTYLLDKTAEDVGATYVIVDMNPSLSSINQNLLMTSDYFIVPTSPDYFSSMAVDSLVNILPRWYAWLEKAKTNSILQNATYPFPNTTPKFLGTIIQNYRPRSGRPTQGFQHWIELINEIVSERLIPELKNLGLALDDDRYGKIEGFSSDYCLDLVPDFNTLIAKSQEEQTPVFALTDEQIGHVGTVLHQNQKKIKEFRDIFTKIADRILILTD